VTAFSDQVASDIASVNASWDDAVVLEGFQRIFMPDPDDFWMTRVDPALVYVLTRLATYEFPTRPGAPMTPDVRSGLEALQLGYVIGRLATRTANSPFRYSGLPVDTFRDVDSVASAGRFREQHTDVFDRIEEVVESSRGEIVDDALVEARNVFPFLAGAASKINGVPKEIAAYRACNGFAASLAERRVWQPAR
jgi:hypothetical protein